jgi:hypothetical protein
MTSVDISLNRHDAVGVLFHPSAVPVIDVFRSLGSLEDQYDLALLDSPEAALCIFLEPGLAKGIVSDALLLAFALTRQRGRPFHFRPIGSRHGSMDEYCLLTMIAASHQVGPEVTQEAASVLDIESLDSLKPLTGEIIRQIELGTIVFQVPDLSEFRAMLGMDDVRTDVIAEWERDPALHFKQ